MRALCTRRDALGLSLSALIPACRSSKEKAPPDEPSTLASVAKKASAEPFGGLEVKLGGDLAEDEQGGTTVVLLHGFGAAGDDLVSLARALRQPRTRYVVPAGLLEVPGGAGGRAWWMLKQRPSAYDDQQELLVPGEALDAARVAVQGVVFTILERYRPQSLFIAGFSQGAMLALEVAAHRASKVDRVAVLSGALPQATSALLAKPRKERPRVFVSHGRQDRVLRFAGAERLVERLKASGHDVTFQPFEGGHEIPPEVSGTLRDFFAPA
ncbi:MAG TPA: alpha/beta fold hydrolase [Polyangiaceae bacterium]|nr:alpha/beta fold hydrolase [Polyangiaceae bacterium]